MKSPRLLLAALALVAMLTFAACGETKDDEPSSSSGAAQESESPAAADPNAPLKTGLSTVSIPKHIKGVGQTIINKLFEPSVNWMEGIDYELKD